MTTKQSGTVKTAWEVWTYDVWGNEEDGWEVNDRSCVDRKRVIHAPAKTYNAGCECEFRAAEPSPKQVAEIFGIDRVDLDGDDTTIYATKDGYPVGELLCVSHKSLSPVGEIVEGFWWD